MAEMPTVLYRDRWLAALAKPAGLETVCPARGESFAESAAQALGLEYLAPAHRLDRDTTGAQLFALRPDCLEKLETMFRDREVRKQYLAHCLGAPRNPTGTIRRNLSQWSKGRRPVSVVKGRGGLEAETEYALLASGETEPKTGLLLFVPRQGRTHQVRVHAAALGYPILGDDNYGDRKANLELKRLCGLKRQALHAWRVAFRHPVTGEETRIECPVPADMRAALDSLLPGWEQSLPKTARQTME